MDARRGSGARRLLDLLSAYPVLDVTRAAKLLGVAFTSDASAIDRLETAGVLTPLSAAARNRAWEAAEVIKLLDAFASRARRR